MNKPVLLVIAAAAGAAVIVRRRGASSKADAALWAEATAPRTTPSPATTPQD